MTKFCTSMMMLLNPSFKHDWTFMHFLVMLKNTLHMCSEWVNMRHESFKHWATIWTEKPLWVLCCPCVQVQQRGNLTRKLRLFLLELLFCPYVPSDLLSQKLPPSFHFPAKRPLDLGFELSLEVFPSQCHSDSWKKTQKQGCWTKMGLPWWGKLSKI